MRRPDTPPLHRKRRSLRAATARWALGFTLSVILVPQLAPQGVQRTAVRDSVGIRIVEHGELGRVVAFSIGQTAGLDLGGLRDNPEEEMHARRPFLLARPLSDGRWLALDWSALKLFDSQGRFIRTIGAAGTGPGEFRQLRTFCIGPGDTVTAVSMSDRRLAVFDTTGRLVETGVVPGEIRDEPCFPDGGLLARVSDGGSGWNAIRVDRRGRLVRRLGSIPDEGRDMTIPGFVSAAVAGEMLLVGAGDESEYRVVDRSGAVVQIVRWNAARQPITEAHRRELVRRGFPTSARQLMWFPTYGRIRPGPQSSVWVQDYPWPLNAPVGYSVFDREGRYLGRVEPPPISRYALEILPLRSDRVVVGWYDSDQMPHVSIHALVRR